MTELLQSGMLELMGDLITQLRHISWTLMLILVIQFSARW